MDISETIQANSDQVNADDLIGGPVTVRVTNVERGSKEQPVFIHTDIFEGRTYRPSKSMRRVLVAGWGSEASEYIGKSMTLFRNPEIRFGGQEVGGIQIAAMSHIQGPLTIALSVSRGKKHTFTVEPLAVVPETVVDEQAVLDALADIHSASSLPALKTAWDLAAKRGVQEHPDVVTATHARKKQLADAGNQA